MSRHAAGDLPHLPHLIVIVVSRIYTAEGESEVDEQNVHRGAGEDDWPSVLWFPC